MCKYFLTDGLVGSGVTWVGTVPIRELLMGPNQISTDKVRLKVWVTLVYMHFFNRLVL